MAVLLAILIYIVFPWLPFVPIVTILLVFALADVFGNAMGGGMKKLKAAAVAVATYLLLRFIFGELLGIYPVDAFDKFAASGGRYWIFWGRDVSQYLLWEALFAAAGGSLAIKTSQGKPGVVRVLFGLAIVVVSIQIVWPNWAAEWPTKAGVDRSLTATTKAIKADASRGGYNFALTTMGGHVSAITLPCGNGTWEPPADALIEVPGSCRASYLVKRPYGSSAFVFDNKAEVDVERHYANGDTAPFKRFTPTAEEFDTEKITGLRFRTSGADPVRVQITLR